MMLIRNCMTRHRSGDLEIGRRRGCWRAVHGFPPSLHPINYTYPSPQLLRIYPCNNTVRDTSQASPSSPQPPALRPVKCAHRTTAVYPPDCLPSTQVPETIVHPLSPHPLLLPHHTPTGHHPSILLRPGIRFSRQPREYHQQHRAQPAHLVDALYSPRFIQRIVNRRVTFNLFFPQPTIPVSLPVVSVICPPPFGRGQSHEKSWA